MPAMPSCKTSCPDDDLVPKGDKNPLKAKQGRKSAGEVPKPNGLIPRWNPLPITNDLEYGLPNLPCTVNRERAIDLFRLLFTDKWMETIVQYTNANAIRILEGEATERKRNGDSPYLHKRHWHPINRHELSAYISGVIHMGLYKEAKTKDYWRTDYAAFGVQHRIREFISLKRWHQIDRFIYIAKPYEGMKSTFERVWDFSEHVQTISCRYWTPGKNVAVDESMQLFTGRAKEITTIPSKKHSTGFKNWIIADHGYVLRLRFHAKGTLKSQGPYRLDPQWKEKLSATEQVVMDLATGSVNGERILPPNKHIIWLDNLFTSIPLLEELREWGIGAAGTVRPTEYKTPREKDAEKKQAKIKVESPIEEPLTQLPISTPIEQAETAEEVIWLDKNPDVEITPENAEPDTKKELFSQDLCDIRQYHTNKVQWGDT